jgi:hypothetical protein
MFAWSNLPIDYSVMCDQVGPSIHDRTHSRYHFHTPKPRVLTIIDSAHSKLIDCNPSQARTVKATDLRQSPRKYLPESRGIAQHLRVLYPVEVIVGRKQPGISIKHHLLPHPLRLPNINLNHLLLLRQLRRLPTWM